VVFSQVIVAPEELADYEKYPDTFFGVHEKRSHRAEAAVELFDFFFECYRDTPKERLLEFLAGSPDHVELAGLPQKDLAEIVSERYVMRAVADGFAVKPPAITLARDRRFSRRYEVCEVGQVLRVSPRRARLRALPRRNFRFGARRAVERPLSVTSTYRRFW